MLELVQDQYKEVNRNLIDIINQPYGIREIESLNHQIHLLRLQKI